MSSTTSPEVRIPLADYFDEIPDDAVLVDRKTPVPERAPNEFCDGTLWQLERAALEDGRDVAKWAVSALGARVYDQRVTVSAAQKEAYEHYNTLAEEHAGELAVVLATPQRDSDWESVYAHVGIIPEGARVKGSPSDDRIEAPTALGFELMINRGREYGDIHLSGNGPEKSLPLSRPTNRHDGFSLIPDRYNPEEVDEYARGTTAVFLTEPEIVPYIVQNYTPEMAAELVLQLGTAMADHDKDKVRNVLGGVPELQTQFEAIKAAIDEHVSFFESVIEGNEGFEHTQTSPAQFATAFKALRYGYKVTDKALGKKYLDTSMVALRQINYEKRTWPHITFGEDTDPERHSIGGILHDLREEAGEMKSRIERAQKNLAILDLLLT